MAINQQRLADWNERGQVEARPLLKALRAADAIQGIPLKPGISEKLFGDLIVGCLLHHKSTLADLQRRREDFRASPYLQSKRIRTTLRRAREIQSPTLAQEADRLLNLDASLKRHGEPIIKQLETRLRFQDPVVCLDALFRHLVLLRRRRTDRTVRPQSLEYYEEDYFPRILEVAGITTPTGKRWKPANIQRHLRPSRGAGVAHARQIAGLLLSLNPALRLYRPEPRFKKGIRPMFGEYQLALQGRMLYSIETIPPPPPWLREPEHQLTEAAESRTP